ncbi:MAG: pilus assembly protein TadG-related protein [Terriglobales bacterium]
MRLNRTISGRKSERGVVILLVAIVLLFVVGAMAVLAIDLVTFYTARSEAQLAADGAALAGARVLANSGMTSNPSDALLVSNAEILARTVATQVAVQNKVGGRNLNAGEVVIPPIQDSLIGSGSNPRVTVQVTRNDLPTFFARIWGRTQITVSAAATAEAYNPSGLTASFGNGPPVAPLCVKPWLLPNIDPDPLNPDPSKHIFDPNTGAIVDPVLLGKDVGTAGGLTPPPCTANGTCAFPLPAVPWVYYPGAQSSFPAPTQALPACSTGYSDYYKSVAGCVQQPVLCGENSGVDEETSFNDVDVLLNTSTAVNCLTHAANNKGDSVDTPAPFQFLAGDDNPVAGSRGTNVMVSDSLVTIPVVDADFVTPLPPPPVKVVGFLQVFLNPLGTAAPPILVPARVINLAGCGKNATGQPIVGNGASPVVVRLVAP